MLSSILSQSDATLDVKYHRNFWAAQTGIWLTVSWRLEGILFIRFWKLTSLKDDLCFQGVCICKQVHTGEYCLSRFSPSGVMPEIKKMAAANLWQWYSEEERQERIPRLSGMSQLAFWRSSFQSQTAESDIYTQYSKDMWVFCVFFLCCAEFPCTFLLFRVLFS